MKKLFPLFVVFLVLLIGCNESESILAPENSSESNTLSKKVGFEKFKIIHSKNFTVDGSKGDRLFVTHRYVNRRGQNLVMSAVLTIPVGAFEGELNFDIIFDLENYAVKLYPSPFTFDIPVVLDLKFSGINLSNSKNEVFDFDYLDGEKENINYKRIKIDSRRKLLAIYGAIIPHFSRYGWTRNKVYTSNSMVGDEDK